MAFECNECNREFSSEQSLSDHNRSKHFVAEKKPMKSFIKGKYVFYLIVILVVLGVVWLVMSISAQANECKTGDASELFISSHTGAKSHDHAELKIVIDGKQELIPASIGVEGTTMRPVHTHDGAGELHIEGPCIRDFTLGDFFNIWNKEFNSQCIFDNCVEEGKSNLKMFVDGEESLYFEDLVLRDGQDIRVEFDSSEG